jgi:hypothetical protein
MKETKTNANKKQCRKKNNKMSVISIISLKLQKFNVVQHGALNHLISPSKQQCNNLIILLHKESPFMNLKSLLLSAVPAQSSVSIFSFYTEQNPEFTSQMLNGNFTGLYNKDYSLHLSIMKKSCFSIFVGPYHSSGGYLLASHCGSQVLIPCHIM